MHRSPFNAQITPNLLEADRELSVRRALEEDLGSGDVTAALVAQTQRARATVVVREAAVLCGRDWFDAVFAAIDPDVTIRWSAADGDRLTADQVVAELDGSARSILSGERAALNFLQTLSGTATVARQYADALAGTECRVLDTRKTIPGLRLAQKYAARTGGAVNHRIGLFDALLIKENHIASAGSIAGAIAAARASSPTLPVEIEVESLDELRQALRAGVERVLLDNFSLDDLSEAVAINGRGADRAELEASGGVEIDDLARIAATGVDFISVGALTKHLRATDYSMRFAFD